MSKIKKSLLSFALGLLRDATKEFAINTSSSWVRISEILPFKGSQNLYDKDIDKTIQAFLPSKGDDTVVLNNEIEKILGRDVFTDFDTAVKKAKTNIDEDWDWTK